MEGRRGGERLGPMSPGCGIRWLAFGTHGQKTSYFVLPHLSNGDDRIPESQIDRACPQKDPWICVRDARNG